MIAVQFPESNVVLAANQDEYEPLPVKVYRNDPYGRVACCFRLSDAELDEIVRTRTIWHVQLTFGKSFQPVQLSTSRPDDL